MGSKYVPGSIIKCVIDGVTYNVPVDANFEFTLARFKNEAVPTSGVNLRKMTRQAQEVKAALMCNTDEAMTLKTLSETNKDITMAVTLASGDVFRTSGWFDFEKYESESMKATITMCPRDKWELM